VEFRVKKRAIAFIGGILISQAVFAQETFEYEAQKGPNLGTLTINERGVSFRETYKAGKEHPEAWHWDFKDIHQLKMSSKSLSVLTYRSNKWKLGADRKYEFKLVSGKTFEQSYAFLKSRLDQRFVAELAERSGRVLWEIPVKHRRRFGGDQGVLRVETGAVVYSSQDKDASRTWRYQDIDNISSSGPFQLNITTFERAKAHYGSRKSFEFQLKQRLQDARYNDLWLRLNQSKGLKILQSYRGGGGA